MNNLTEDKNSEGNAQGAEKAESAALLARYIEHSSALLRGLMDTKQLNDPNYNWDKLRLALGIPNSTMSLIKNGKMALSVQLLPIAARELNCNQTDFLPVEDRVAATKVERERFLEADLVRTINAVARKNSKATPKDALDIALKSLKTLGEYPTPDAIDEAIDETLLKSHRESQRANTKYQG